MIVPDFTRNDFKKSGISDITLDEYIHNGYLIDTPDYWQLKYPNLFENVPTDYYNSRLKNPTEKKKYIKPKDMPSRLFRPLALSPNIISNRNEYIIITEGEKKAIKAVQEGFNCIALAGVWAWKQKPKPKENDDNNNDIDDIDTDNTTADIIPDISNSDFENKTIYLCYDNDMWLKPQVKQALYQFSAYLIAEKKAVVKIIKLPQSSEKLGLDDYLIKYGDNEFKKLLDNAESIDLRKIQQTLSGKSDLKIDFPVEIFPEKIKNLAIDLHKRLDAPLEYICCTFLSTISMLMDYRFIISVNPSSNWIEHPVLWCALVGKPSQKKTPCLNIGKKILDTFEFEMQEKYETDLKKYNNDYIRYKAELEVYRQKIKKDKNVEIPEEPIKPLKPRITTQNATVEALCMAISLNKDVKRGIGIWLDELSYLFYGLNQYKSGNGNDTQYFLQAWERKRQNVIRKNNNEDITIEVSHNIIGGIQPKVLDKTIFKEGIDSVEGMIERWLYCCTEYKNTGILPIKKEQYDISALQNCCTKIFKYNDIPKDIPKTYKFDENALKQFSNLYETVNKDNTTSKKTDLLESYITKQLSYIARFSLILHCMEDLEKSEIKIDTLNNAIKLSRYFINCFQNLVAERITVNPLENYTLNLLLTKNITTISPNELYKKNKSRFNTLENAKITLENLACKGYGRICKSGTRGHKFIFYG